MPLVTQDIVQARGAYALLETRAQSAEQSVALLRTTVDTLSQVSQTAAASSAVLHDFAVGQSAANSQIVANQAAQVAPDVSLQAFISALSLSAALAEATMPGRSIGGLGANVQCFVTLQTAPDGVSNTLGLRLYQPEFGVPAAAATASFTVGKLAPPPGQPAQPNLYASLQDKQALFSRDEWAGLTDAAGASPAAALVSRVTQMLGGSSGWTMPGLETDAATVADLEVSLADAAHARFAGAALTAWRASAVALGALARTARQTYTVGDLAALTQALAATTTWATATLG